MAKEKSQTICSAYLLQLYGEETKDLKAVPLKLYGCFLQKAEMLSRVNVQYMSKLQVTSCHLSHCAILV